MKLRNGFVSNSSSSSFIVATNNEITKEYLLKLFKLEDGNPLYPIAKQLATFIAESVSEMSAREIEEELTYACPKHIQEEIIKRKYKIYHGFACDDESGIERAFCEMDVNYADDDLIFYKEGGY